MSEKIICKINQEPNIKIKVFNEEQIKLKIFSNPDIKIKLCDTPITVKVHDNPNLVVRFGERGLRGRDGDNTDHSLLSHLDYDNSGHTNFQKKLTYVPEYKAYEVS